MILFVNPLKYNENNIMTIKTGNYLVTCLYSHDNILVYLNGLSKKILRINI